MERLYNRLHKRLQGRGWRNLVVSCRSGQHRSCSSLPPVSRPSKGRGLGRLREGWDSLEVVLLPAMLEEVRVPLNREAQDTVDPNDPTHRSVSVLVVFVVALSVAKGHPGGLGGGK